jgi:class 3 adenylate cyclase
LTEPPDDAELERLGLYDPAAPGADDLRTVLERVFELGATVEEVSRAAPLQLGPLALDLAMRPAGETCDLDAFAETSGLDPLLVRQFWTALGLPRSGAVRVTPDAAEALRLFAFMVSVMDPDTVFALARVAGSSSARLAEALSNAFRVEVELPHRAAESTTYASVVDESVTAVRDLLPLFLDAVAAVFRRHLVLVSYALWSTDEEQTAVTIDRTVGFADLVSSTAAVRGGSVRALARMVREFEELVWDVVASAGGRVVKLIGDEAMFVIEDPSRACDMALRLVDASPQPVRVGLAHGTVVALYGDYYGETVNLAARLVNAAEPSTVTASASVRDSAESAFMFEPLPEQELKGFGAPVVFYRAGRH